MATPIHRASATAGFGLSDNEQAKLLSRHNEERAKYGTPALTWDDSLATLAADWANKLAAGDGSISHRPNNRNGENIFGSGPPSSDSAIYAVDDWVSEVANYNFQTNTCSATCGHFTQVVWSATRRVGCGKASGAGWDFVVCDYDPAGNFIGQSAGITPPSTAATTPPQTTDPATTTTTAPANTVTTPANTGTAPAANPPTTPAQPASNEIAPLDCSAAAKSIDAAQAATVVFDNRTSGTLSVSWIDYGGVAQPWFTLPAGQTLTQVTYATHAWKVVDGSSSCRGIYVPAAAGTSNVTIS